MLSHQTAWHNKCLGLLLGTEALAVLPNGIDSRLLLQQAAGLQIEALILSANSNLTLGEIEDTFQFPLDRFQKDAVQMFLAGSSVLVCAPTGAGKTAIAEAAAVAVLARSASLRDNADLCSMVAACAVLLHVL